MEKFLREQFTQDRLVAEVGVPGNLFFLAYAGDKVTGYLKLRENPAGPQNSLELARIYVEKDFIGKGVGRMLMEKSIEVARLKNKEYLWLGVWKKNERAIRFYDEWGFTIFGEQDFVLGDDRQKDWLMRLSL